MMWSRFRSSFIAYIKIISHDKTILTHCLAPFILLILLKFAFPPLSGFIFSKTGLLLDKYYSLIAITFVSIIAILPGIAYAFIFIDERYLNMLHTITATPAGRRKFLLINMIKAVSTGFVLVIITILLTRPVPTEGWLRNLFAASLLSIQSLFVFMFIISFSKNRTAGLAFSRLYWIFLIAAPLGLLLHHSLNYLVFFSPMYWVAWAWVVPSPFESLIYGSIAVILTSGAVVIFFLYYLRKLVS
jgi:hypothetical protein